jgi:hypothetical protein
MFNAGAKRALDKAPMCYRTPGVSTGNRRLPVCFSTSVRHITQGLFPREQREAANERILLTPMNRSDYRSGRNLGNTQMTNVSTNMEASRNAGRHGRNALSAAELDAVSGGIKAIDITVAGMHIVANYNLEGKFNIMVRTDDAVIRRGGAV